VKAGWYTDPTERFSQRYHDGDRWTEGVVDDDGAPRTDAEAVTGDEVLAVPTGPQTSGPSSGSDPEPEADADPNPPVATPGPRPYYGSAAPSGTASSGAGWRVVAAVLAAVLAIIAAFASTEAQRQAPPTTTYDFSVDDIDLDDPYGLDDPYDCSLCDSYP
jgi:hypothetical protein